MGDETQLVPEDILVVVDGVGDRAGQFIAGILNRDDAFTARDPKLAGRPCGIRRTLKET